MNPVGHHKSPSLPLIACVLAAILAWPLLDAHAWQQESRRTVRGTVFEDTNGNGRRDADEQAIGGVAVSDQATVAQTAANGTYELAADENSSVVFISLPDEWAAPAGFWRPLKFEGNKARVDFALRPREKNADFIFIHASDTHLSPQSLPRIRRLREIVEREKPAFLLITGDLVRDALRVPESEASAYYNLFAAELAKFTVPVWTVPGNHENFGIERHHSLVSAQHPLYGKGMYRKYLGPTYFSFTWGGIHFVGLDTADIDDLWYYGHIDAAQLAWLKKDLAAVPPGMPVVTFNHIPLASAVDALHGYDEDPPAPSVIRVKGRAQYRHIVSNTAELLQALAPHRLEIALGGHMHTPEALLYQTDTGPVRFHQTGAVVGPNEAGGLKFPSGVMLYRVRGGKVDNGTFLPLD